MAGTTGAFHQNSSTEVILWSCVLVLLLVAGFMLVMRVKRRLQDDEVDANPSASAGFTLSDLRQLRRDGVMSDEEFEMAKAKIVESARRAALRNVPDRELKPPDVERDTDDLGGSELSDET
jgi:uncharacterized membrane protein